MNVLLVVIVACEIGFWVAVVSGLVARYLLGRKRLGAILLALAPLVDGVLLVAVVLDLRGGATASFSHSLAAIYLGVSIAYGHSMITWADLRFAHRFGDGPAPRRLYGSTYAAKCWRDVVRTVLAVGIAAGIIVTLRAVVGDAARTEALASSYPVLAVWLAVDLVWAVDHTAFPKQTPAAASRSGQPAASGRSRSNP